MEAIKINIDSKDTIIYSFKRIAQDLIMHKQIRVNDVYYSFVDIEFYYYHKKNHPDSYAKKIQHNRPKGEFEIHRYGVDISLGNQPDDFGGILIRGLYDEMNEQVIPKAQVLKAVYNQFVQGDNYFGIVDKTTQWKDIFKTKRLNLGKAKNNEEQKFSDARYRFLAKDKRVFKKYPDKEKLFRQSDLSAKEIEEILDYKLSI